MQNFEHQKIISKKSDYFILRARNCKEYGSWYCNFYRQLYR